MLNVICVNISCSLCVGVLWSLSLKQQIFMGPSNGKVDQDARSNHVTHFITTAYRWRRLEYTLRCSLVTHWTEAAPPHLVEEVSITSCRWQLMRKKKMKTHSMTICPTSNPNNRDTSYRNTLPSGSTKSNQVWWCRYSGALFFFRLYWSTSTTRIAQCWPIELWQIPILINTRLDLALV